MNETFFKFNDPILALAWSPCGKRLAVAGVSGPCAVLDPATGGVLCEIAGHRGGTLALDWSSQHDALLTSGADGRAVIWNADSGALVRELDGGSPWVECARYSPDGAHIATGAGRRLRVWSASGELKFECAEHESTVSALDWRADSRGLVSACYGKLRCFRTYLAEPHVPYEVLKWKASFLSVGWNATGRYVAAGTQEGTVQFYRLPSRGQDPLQMSGYASKIRRLAWDHTGRWLATDGGPVAIVWDTSGSGPRGTTPREHVGHLGRISAVAFQRRGPLLASGCEKGVVFFWNSSAGNSALKTMRCSATINHLAWSPDDTQVAVGCQDGSVHLMDATVPQPASPPVLTL